MKGSGFIVTGFKRFFAYKSQVIARIISSPIELFIMVIVWTSLFNYSGLDLIGGFTLQGMINYYIVIWLMTSIVSDNSDVRLGANIYHGDLNTRLLKPVKIHVLYFFDSLGDKLGGLLVQVLPFTLFSVLFLGFSASGVINALLALVSFFLAYLIYFFFNLFFGLIAFKLRAYKYISNIKRTVINLFSGKLVPLSLFPVFLGSLLNYTPFVYIYSAPASIFLGDYSLIQSILVMTAQIVWILVLYVLFRMGWRKSLREFEGVGT